jgi:hypothetical protein
MASLLVLAILVTTVVMLMMMMTMVMSGQETGVMSRVGHVASVVGRGWQETGVIGRARGGYNLRDVSGDDYISGSDSLGKSLSGSDSDKQESREVKDHF